MTRLYKPGAFIKETIGAALQLRPTQDRSPMIGVDEGLNDKKHVWPMLRRLVSSEKASRATPLWWQVRTLADGSSIVLNGSSVDGYGSAIDVGRPLRPARSSSDEQLVAYLVAHFLTEDKLCLLTQNTKRDAAGLRQILETEIAPALESLVPKRLGLLTLAQRPNTRVSDYSDAVEDWLTKRVIEPGFRWELLP